MPTSGIEWNYDIQQISERLNTCSAALAAFIFKDDLHDNPSLANRDITQPYTGPLSFSSLAQDIASGHEALYELFSRAHSLEYPYQPTHHWILAALLYRYAGDASSAARMAYRWGITPDLRRTPPEVRQAVHMMLFSDARDYIHGVPTENEGHLEDFNFMVDPEGNFTLIESVMLIAAHRKNYDPDACFKAVCAAWTAYEEFMAEEESTDALAAICLAASFKAEYIRLPDQPEDEESREFNEILDG